MNDELRRVFREDINDYVDKAAFMSKILGNVKEVEPYRVSPAVRAQLEEPNGRDAPLSFTSVFDRADDLIEDVLDAELVFRMRPAPEDPLDEELAFEEHCARCRECHQLHAQVCAHCLELKLCKPVDGDNNPTEVQSYYVPGVTIYLCRQCRTSANNGGLEVA